LNCRWNPKINGRGLQQSAHYKKTKCLLHSYNNMILPYKQLKLGYCTYDRDEEMSSVKHTCITCPEESSCVLRFAGSARREVIAYWFHVGHLFVPSNWFHARRLLTRTTTADGHSVLGVQISFPRSCGDTMVVGLVDDRLKAHVILYYNMRCDDIILSDHDSCILVSDYELRVIIGRY